MNNEPKKEKATQSTNQQIHPARKVLRTVIAMGIGFIPLGTIVIRELGLESVPFFAAALGLGASITRILAYPQTAKFLEQYVPWLYESTYHGKHRIEDKEEDANMHG